MNTQQNTIVRTGWFVVKYHTLIDAQSAILRLYTIPICAAFDQPLADLVCMFILYYIYIYIYLYMYIIIYIYIYMYIYRLQYVYVNSHVTWTKFNSRNDQKCFSVFDSFSNTSKRRNRFFSRRNANCKGL